MSTTRIFGNNPFEVFLKPTNKIEISISPGGATAFTRGTVVAYDKDGNIVAANASDRYLSSVLGVVTDIVSGKYTVVTQGLIPNITPSGVLTNAKSGDVYFLSPSKAGFLQATPPVALGTTRIAVAQKVDGGYLVLGTPGIVNGLSYRGYVNISAIQPIGTVSPFIGNSDSVPKNWLFCDGSYISIDAYPDLFRLVGSIYGEVLDGRFKLPDFRGRTLVGAGGSNNLSTRLIGEFGGEEQHKISLAEMPSHNHRPAVGANDGVDHWWGSDNRIGSPNFDYDGNTTTKPSDGFIAPSYKTDSVGGNSPHNNMPPYSVANWIIRAKAESEFALLDVNVESLTNVEKDNVATDGDMIRFDGETWRFVNNTLANAKDLTVSTDVTANDIIAVKSVTDGIPTFKTIAPSGTNITIDTTERTHKNGSPRPAAVTVLLPAAVPVGRKGIIHFNGTIEIESTNGSMDGIVNINLTGYQGAGGLTQFDTLVQPHYVQGDIKSMKIPFHATIAAQTYAGAANGTYYRYSYYLSTETGSQFKANRITINNVKFVY